jgi:hypothetical protein
MGDNFTRELIEVSGLLFVITLRLRPSKRQISKLIRRGNRRRFAARSASKTGSLVPPFGPRAPVIAADNRWKGIDSLNRGFFGATPNYNRKPRNAPNYQFYNRSSAGSIESESQSRPATTLEGARVLCVS